MFHHRTPYELADFLEGKLPPQKSAEIESHLAACADCQREAEELRQTLGLLTRQQWSTPSPLYFTTLLPRVRASVERTKKPTDPILVQYALRIAALFLIVIVGYSVLSQWENTIPPREITDRSQSTHDAVFILNDENLLYQREFGEIPALYIAAQLSDSVLIQKALLEGEQITFHTTLDDDQFYTTFPDQTQEVLVAYLEERM